ncbi:MAG TPA: hypothetical protein VJN21_11285 [Candidatus Acidoferrales bacterium]|nr:hypothetical protein [Candidatus Acidoferrales bacterium]
MAQVRVTYCPDSWVGSSTRLDCSQRNMKPAEDIRSEGMEERKVNLTDEQIVTERKLGRRSFLAATGALLLGAAALASGVVAQDAPQKAADPDSKDKPKKKAGMKKAGTKKAGMKKGADPDKKKGEKKPAEKKADPDGARR